jgi:hypothetical protein
MPFPKMFVVRLHTVCFLVNLQAALPADAQLVQVPDLTGFGNSANAYPFSSAYGPMRYQQIYASSEFPHGGTIDKIMFRDDEFPGTQYRVDIDLQIAFAYAATTVDRASTVFARNIGDDFTIVLDGTITESFDDASLPPTTFDFILDVANTFIYDPSRGDLLMQVLVRGTYAFTFFDASLSPQQDVTTRIWSLRTDATVGTIGLPSSPNGPYGLVTQFQFIPEPSTIAQFGAMLVLITAHRRRHAKPFFSFTRHGYA